MKKLFTILAIALCSTLAMAQTNQYFWAGGQFIMGNPIDQLDSITFGQLEDTDSIMLYLPRIVKVVHDTVIKYVTIHDTICPDQPKLKDGVMPGEFSVSAMKKVHFSQGNLQFNAANGEHLCADGTTKQGTWRFAEHQYDALTTANTNISASYNGWIDLFGWGTSGYNGKNPYMATEDNADYQYGSSGISDTYYDWGVYNSIENGGNKVGLWRTLSKEESTYILNGRANASLLYGFANVVGVNGLIILPDNWELPSEISFIAATTQFSKNTYSEDQWYKMETNGAIFLPITGARLGTSVMYLNTGSYQSTSYSDYDRAYSSFEFAIEGDLTTTFAGWKRWGRAVRLVQEVK